MAKILSEGKSIDATIISTEQLPTVTIERLRILKTLNEPKTPARLAKELKMRLQTIYYHLRLLKEQQLVIESGQPRQYASNAPAVAAIIDETKWKPFTVERQRTPEYLKPLIKGGFFDAKIIIGSPEAHGKYRARGTEFCIAELAMHLGNYASFEYPLYYLDTEVRDAVKKENLILLGGPKVNTLVEEANRHLPIRFDEKTFAIHSTLSGKKYGENAGVLEICQSPFNPAKKIMVIAGLNHTATRVAILAMLKERKKLEQNNSADPNVFAKVVQGYDEDGDGIVDTVEVLE